MASSTEQVPSIDIELSLSPSSHSFEDPSPPTITLRLTSHAKSTLTLFTWRSLLDLKMALVSNGFIITDQTTGQLVPTARIMVQRNGGCPLRRTRGSSDEGYFLMLEPDVPVTLSRPFGRGDGSVKPQPKTIVKRGWELDEHGNEMKIRRSANATGVDGLEPGHQYLVELNPESLNNLRWTFATKDEVLVDHTGTGSYFDDYSWERTPLHFNMTETLLTVLD